MSRYTLGSPTEVPPTHDYTQYAKRIREVTRKMLRNNKDTYPDHVYSAFVAYADAVVSFLDTADQNARLQEEYDGMITDLVPDQDSTGENNVDVMTTTAQLLGVQSTPEASVKQGLGIKSIKPRTELPKQRKGKKK